MVFGFECFFISGGGCVMKKLLFLLVVIFTASAVLAGGPSKSDISFAKNWDEALLEAKIRNVPIIFIWPEKS